MAKQFDATLKDLIEAYPADWLVAVGVPVTGPIEVLSPDLSTVTASADALIRAGDAVVHIDLQSGPDPSLATRMLLYNVLAHRRTGLPVHSVVVLLRPNANSGRLTNEVRYSVHPSGELAFRFEVVRVWETPAEELLTRGIGLLPLAVLGRMPGGRTRADGIPDVVEQIADEAVRQLPFDRAARLVASALILAGMHLTRDQVRAINRRLPAVIESVTFEVWEEMGREKQLHDTLLALGRAKFGVPTPEQEQSIRGIEDLARLNRMTLAVLKARTWTGLLRTK
jgi:hypothetical protein